MLRTTGLNSKETHLEKLNCYKFNKKRGKVVNTKNVVICFPQFSNFQVLLLLNVA